MIRTKQELVLRDKPSAISHIIDIIPPNTELKLLNNNGKWLEISYVDSIGFVSVNGIEFVEEQIRINTVKEIDSAPQEVAIEIIDESNATNQELKNDITPIIEKHQEIQIDLIEEDKDEEDAKEFPAIGTTLKRLRGKRK